MKQFFVFFIMTIMESYASFSVFKKTLWDDALSTNRSYFKLLVYLFYGKNFENLIDTLSDTKLKVTNLIKLCMYAKEI